MVSSEPHNLCHVLEAFVSGVPTSLSHGTFYSGRFRVLLRKQLVSTHIKPLAVVLIDDTLELSTGFLRACSRVSFCVQAFAGTTQTSYERHGLLAPILIGFNRKHHAVV